MIMYEPDRSTILLVAGVFASAASLISFWLIMRHQQNMSNSSVQSKIVGIIWMIPIYSIDSFLGLWIPHVADYVNMLRDCYEVRTATQCPRYQQLQLWVNTRPEHRNSHCTLTFHHIQAYVLYLFLSLMLSYLGCEDEECEFDLITYLEKQPPVKRTCPFNWMCGDELPRGREFLRCVLVLYTLMEMSELILLANEIQNFLLYAHIKHMFITIVLMFHSLH